MALRQSRHMASATSPFLPLLREVLGEILKSGRKGRAGFALLFFLPKAEYSLKCCGQSSLRPVWLAAQVVWGCTALLESDTRNGAAQFPVPVEETSTNSHGGLGVMNVRVTSQLSSLSFTFSASPLPPPSPYLSFLAPSFPCSYCLVGSCGRIYLKGSAVSPCAMSVCGTDEAV